MYILDKVESWAKAHDNETNHILYCYYEWFEASATIYRRIADKCKELGITKVYDIGCCYPFQADFFTDNNIEYIGIDILKDVFYNKTKIIHKKYPFEIKTDDKNKTAAIAILCMGYLINRQESWKQISNDFNYYFGEKGQALLNFTKQEDILYDIGLYKKKEVLENNG